MTVFVVFDAPGMTEAQYDQVRIEVAGDHPPEGALYHVAGPTDTGWCVVEVWDSPKALERFVDEKLKAALQRVGCTAQPRVSPVARIMHP